MHNRFTALLMLALGLCLLSKAALFAQSGTQPAIDSLKQVIATAKSDTVRGRAQCRLCESLSNAKEFGQAQKQAEEGMQVAGKSKDIEGQALCFQTMGRNYLNQSMFDSTLVMYEHSLVLEQKVGNDYRIANVLFLFGVAYIWMADFPKSIEYHKKAYAIYEKINHSNEMMSCLKNLAYIHINLSDYPTALKYNKLAIDILQASGDSVGMAEIWGNQAAIFSDQGKINDALQYNLKASKVFESKNMTNNMAKLNISIGSLYQRIGNYPKAGCVDI